MEPDKGIEPFKDCVTKAASGHRSHPASSRLLPYLGGARAHRVFTLPRTASGPRRICLALCIGVEPITESLEEIRLKSVRQSMELMRGVEPPSKLYESLVLPLYYTSVEVRAGFEPAIGDLALCPAITADGLGHLHTPYATLVLPLPTPNHYTD